MAFWTVVGVAVFWIVQLDKFERAPSCPVNISDIGVRCMPYVRVEKRDREGGGTMCVTHGPSHQIMQQARSCACTCRPHRNADNVSC